MQSSAFECVFDHIVEFGFSSQGGGRCTEMTLDGVGDDLRQGGLAGAGRTPVLATCFIRPNS